MKVNPQIQNVGSLGFINFLGKNIVFLTSVFYFLVAVMFYLRTYDSAQIKITIVQIGGVVLLAMLLAKIIEENSWNFFAKNATYVAPILTFFVSAVISYFRSPFVWMSGHELIRRVVYFTLPLVIMKEFNSRKKVDRLLNWVLAATFVSTFYGLIQFLDGKYFPPNPEPGLDPFIWRQAFSYRIFSTFGNPNFFGDFLAVTGPITLALFIKSGKPYLLILWLMTLFNVYVTYSKGAWIGYVAGHVLLGLVYIFFFPHPKTVNIKKHALLVITLVSLLTGGAVYFQLTQRTDSAKFRIFTWLSTWEMINTKPILGTGIGSFQVTYPAWRRPQIFFVEGKHNTQSNSPESEYLEILHDEGLVGFGIFLWLIAIFFIGGFKALKSFSNIDTKSGRPDFRAYYLLGLLAASGGMLVHNLVCVSLRFVSSGVMLWFLLGMIGSLIVNNPLGEVSFNSVASGGIPVKIRRLLVFVIIPPAIWAVTVFYGFFKADIHHNIAIFFSKQARWSEALTNYNIVSEKNYGFVMCHYFMGNVFNDRWILSRVFHPEWGDKEADKPWVEIDLGKEGRIDPERSIDKYTDVWRVAPNYVQSHHQAGLVYMKLGGEFKDRGDDEKMRSYWNKSLGHFWRYHTIDPIFPANYQRMAWVYLQMGDMDMVEKVYKAHLYTQWLLQNPEDIINPENIKTQEERKKFDDLMSQFKEEVEWRCCEHHNREYYLLFPEDWARRRASEYSDSYFQLANLYYLRRNFSDAEKFYNRAIDRHSENLHAWKNLIALYRETNKMERLNEAVRRYRELFPEDMNLSRLGAI